jgi:hypothetical protein
MTASEHEARNSLPLIGWIFHSVVRLGFLGGVALAGWVTGDGGVRGGCLAAFFVAVISAIWAFTYAVSDPDRRRWARVRVPGRVRLLLELLIIAIGGVAIWIYWNRAAAETYYTIAAFDYSVQYRRIVTMYQSG